MPNKAEFPNFSEVEVLGWGSIDKHSMIRTVYVKRHNKKVAEGREVRNVINCYK